MTIDVEIAECVETNHVTGKSKIKEGVPKEKIKQIEEVNKLYKRTYGQWLWTFEK